MASRKNNMLLFMLLIYTFVFWFSKELTRPAISIALSDNVDSNSTVGFLLSLQNFLPLILSIPFSTLGDKFGQEKILHFSSIMTAVSGLLFVCSGIPAFDKFFYLLLITAGQIISGISWTTAWIALQALVSDIDNTGKGINNIILIMSVGLIAGPLVSGYMVDGISIYSVWMLNAALCVVQFCISQYALNKFKNKNLEQAEKAEPSVREKNVIKGIYIQLGGLIYICMMILSFVMMFGSEIRSSYLPVILRSNSTSSETIGIIVSAGAAATCVIRFIMNLPICSKISAKMQIYISMLLGTAGLLSIAFIKTSNAMYITSILLGLCAGIVEPVIINYILKNAKQNRKGLALAGRVLMNRLGMVMAPLSAGALTSICGNSSGFIIITVCIATLVLIAVIGQIVFEKRSKYNGKETKN